MEEFLNKFEKIVDSFPLNPSYFLVLDIANDVSNAMLEDDKEVCRNMLLKYIKIECSIETYNENRKEIDKLISKIKETLITLCLTFSRDDSFIMVDDNLIDLEL